MVGFSPRVVGEAGRRGHSRWLSSRNSQEFRDESQRRSHCNGPGRFGTEGKAFRFSRTNGTRPGSAKGVRAFVGQASRLPSRGASETLALRRKATPLPGFPVCSFFLHPEPAARIMEGNPFAEVRP